MEKDGELFEKCKQDILEFYNYKKHSQLQKSGYKFLYCPKGKLIDYNRIILVGWNPGGEENDELLSDERGNTFKVEDEKPSSGPQSPHLREQILKLFDGISSKMKNGNDGKMLLNGTLTSNFIPFRSKGKYSWPKSLRHNCIDFSEELWKEILSKIPEPNIIVSFIGNGKEYSYHYFRKLFLDDGWEVKEKESESREVGWGKHKVFIYELNKENKPAILMVCLPHLSQFKFIKYVGKEKKRRHAFDYICERIANHYEGNYN